jgi:adenylosuccinate synthase
MLGWLLTSVGLINQKCLAFIGSGVVVNVPALFNELDTLESKGECFLAG